MNKLTRNVLLGLSLATTALAGTAFAEQTMRGEGDCGRMQTRAEVQTRSVAIFARMDANKDGKLDPADREARRNQMFDRLDTDKSGQISRAEFGTRSSRSEGMARREGAGREGGHGKPGGWGGRGGRGHHGGMMMGRMADANKDGAITQAEFTAAALQRFDASDANKDGQITKEERQAKHKAMRDEWRAKRAAAPVPPSN